MNVSPTNAEAPAPSQVIEPLPEWQRVHDPLFEKIGYCESENNLKAKNPNSSASGEFQWLNSSWKYYAQRYWGDEWVHKDIFSQDNRELSWYVYTHYGTKDWQADSASYDCWKSEIPNGMYNNVY